MTDNIFFTPFENLKAFDLPPEATELVRPVQDGLDFSKIGGGILGSAMETGQTFRNIFDTSVTPDSISSMVSSGLMSEAQKLLKGSGLSNLVGGSSKTFNKTSYGYEDAEKKLNSAPNLSPNTSPLRIYDMVLEKLVNQIQTPKGKEKESEDFYLTLDLLRKRIWDLNSRLWINLEKLISIHKSVNKSEPLSKIFYTEEIFNSRESVLVQIKNLVYLIQSYVSGHEEMFKWVQNRTEYIECIELLRTQSSEFLVFTKHPELDFIQEDLKLLRRTPNQDFVPIKR